MLFTLNFNEGVRQFVPFTATPTYSSSNSPIFSQRYNLEMADVLEPSGTFAFSFLSGAKDVFTFDYDCSEDGWKQFSSDKCNFAIQILFNACRIQKLVIRVNNLKKRAIPIETSSRHLLSV